MESELMKDLIYTLLEGRQTATITLNDRDLPLGEFIALGQIEDNREHSPENVYADDLQRVLFVSKPAISQMFKSLEKKGYIKRDINPENRRKLTVVLTSQGREALDHAKSYYKVSMARIIETFGQEKTRQLIGLLSEFAAVARDVRKDLGSGAAYPPQSEVRT